jgi:hypothetical protein
LECAYSLLSFLILKAFFIALLMKTNNKNAKPEAIVAAIAIMAFFGLAFLSGGSANQALE